MTDETTAPDVSVVIPCYNAERWVGRAIDSVLAQEGVTVEVIVIDDGSTDGSTDVLRRYDGRIHWETGPNRGACAARNRGLALARADYVMFLDADDYVEGPFLRNLRNQMDTSGSDCAIGVVADASEDASPKLRVAPRTQSWETLIIDWLHGKFIPPCGLIWKTSYIKNLGGWSQHLSKNQDGEIVLRAASKMANFCSCSIGRGIYWNHASSSRISNNKTTEKILDSLSVYQKLQKDLQTSDRITSDIDCALSRVTHQLERSAIKSGLHDAAHKVSEYRRIKNWQKYEGTRSHVLACMLIGLRKKEMLSKSMRSFAKHVLNRTSKNI